MLRIIGSQATVKNRGSIPPIVLLMFTNLSI